MYFNKFNTVRILLYLSVLTVYTPLIPIGIETQPVIFIVTFFLVKIVIKPNGPLPIQRELIFFFFLALVAYTLLSTYWFGVGSLIQATKYILPVLLCLMPCSFYRSPSVTLQNSIASLHVILAVLYMLGLTSFIGDFYGRYTSDTASSRGFSFFSYEPSYASTYLFTLFIIARYGKFLESKRSPFAELVYIFCILLTKSFLGFIFIFLALMTYASASIRKLFPFALLTAFFIALGYIFSGGNNRLVEVIEALSLVDSTDILTSFVILEPSGTSRLLVNFYSLVEVLNAPLGHGVGSFETVWPEVMNLASRDVLEKNILILDFLKDGKASPQSYVACLMFETGVLGVAFLVIIATKIINNCRYNKKINWLLVNYFLIYLLIQSQTSNPIYIFTLILIAKAFDNMRIHAVTDSLGSTRG